jgi:DNA-binding GntR family transcriptional regulator
MSAKVSADSIHLRLREAILAGEFKDGDRLRESDIAQQFQVSRTPAREGLRRLQADGLVTITPNVGATVTAFGPKELHDLLDVRASLESLGARISAQRAGEDEIEAVAGLASEILEVAESDDPTRFERVAQMNVDFHRRLVSLSGNRTLEVAVAPMIHASLAARAFSTYTEDRALRSARQHVEIVEAIRSRDADWAAAALMAHLLAARESMTHPRETPPSASC